MRTKHVKDRKRLLLLDLIRLANLANDVCWEARENIKAAAHKALDAVME